MGHKGKEILNYKKKKKKEILPSVDKDFVNEIKIIKKSILNLDLGSSIYSKENLNYHKYFHVISLHIRKKRFKLIRYSQIFSNL